MLDAGVDIDQTDVDGTNALVVSIMNKKYTFAKFLLDRGANPNLADIKGRAALYAAVDIRNEDYSALPSRKGDDPLPSIEIVKALLARGANPNLQLTKNLPGRSGMDSGDITLDEGTTPLMRAARSGRCGRDAGAARKGSGSQAHHQRGNHRAHVCRRRRLSR